MVSFHPKQTELANNKIGGLMDAGWHHGGKAYACCLSDTSFSLSAIAMQRSSCVVHLLGIGATQHGNSQSRP